MLFEYETDRLLLRILKPEDAPAVLDFFQHDRTYFEYYEPDRVPNFYTIDHQKTLLRCEYNLAFNSTLFRYYVFRKEDPGRVVGTVCFHNIIPGVYSTCELGYKFAQDVQHQGLAAEACERLIRAIYDEQKIHRVTAMVEPDNQPSKAFLERMHFQREGLCRGFARVHGEWTDYELYARLAEDYVS